MFVVWAPARQRYAENLTQGERVLQPKHASRRSFCDWMLGCVCLLLATPSAATTSKNVGPDRLRATATAPTDVTLSDTEKLTGIEPARNLESNPSGSALEQSKAKKAPDSEGSLGPEAALSRNLALYEIGQYEACVLGLREILDATRGSKLQRPELIDQAETYLGACLIASGRSEEADQVFAEAIRNNPQMRAPDNLIFPQTVVDRFLRVREQLLNVIRRDERNRVQDAEQKAQQQDERRKKEVWVAQELRVLAARETVIEKNKRWMATVPFGIGQFQNSDNTAGWIFLGLESALIGTCVTALAIDEHLANQALVPGIDTAELRTKRDDAYRVIVASSWGFLGVMAGGIAHAHWRFVAERRYTRKRKLPSELDAPELGNQGRSNRSEGQSTTSFSLTGITWGQGIGIVGRF